MKRCTGVAQFEVIISLSLVKFGIKKNGSTVKNSNVIGQDWVGFWFYNNELLSQYTLHKWSILRSVWEDFDWSILLVLPEADTVIGYPPVQVVNSPNPADGQWPTQTPQFHYFYGFLNNFKNIAEKFKMHNFLSKEKIWCLIFFCFVNCDFFKICLTSTFINLVLKKGFWNLSNWDFW